MVGAWTSATIGVERTETDAESHRVRSSSRQKPRGDGHHSHARSMSQIQNPERNTADDSYVRVTSLPVVVTQNHENRSAGWPCPSRQTQNERGRKTATASGPAFRMSMAALTRTRHDPPRCPAGRWRSGC